MSHPVSDNQEIPKMRTRTNGKAAAGPVSEPKPKVTTNKPSTRSKWANAVKKIVQSLKDFDPDTFKLIQSLQLSTLSHCPEEIRAMWTESTTSTPQLLSSQHCWTRAPSNTTDLILATLDQIQGAKSDLTIGIPTYRRGEVDSTLDPRLAVAQLAEPNPNDPISIIGLRLEIMPDNLLKAPVSLSKFVEPFEEEDLQLLLTPKYCATDLHLDAADGLSTPLGRSEKVWLCFPPTNYNLNLMQKAQGQKAKLARIGKELEGGLIFKTDSSHAVYLPAGTLHAVFTLVGGFLAAIDFITTTSSFPFSSLIKLSLDGSGDFQVSVFDRFLSSLSLGLDNNRVMEALRAWLNVSERAAEWAEANAGWRKSAREIWSRFLASPPSQLKDIVCPCGEMEEGATFKAHFMAAHSVNGASTTKRKRGGEGAAAAEGAKRKKI